MQTVRQMASGLVYAIVSLLLVIGGLSLSLAQGATPAAATSTKAQVQTASPTQSLLPSTPSATSTPAATLTVGTTTAPATVTTTNTAVVATSRPLQTSTSACGPYTGWIRSYFVQPGDTLFRIATLHGISVEVLKRANCRTGTLIYVGEKLWVPFMLPPPTALTIIPTFDTPTDEVTPTSSPTATPTTAT